MKKLLSLILIAFMFCCASTKQLNEQIYEAQKKELEVTPYESAQWAFIKIENQKKFRQELPKAFKSIVFNQLPADTTIIIEVFDEICSNCPAAEMMVLRNDTIHTLKRSINRKGKDSFNMQKELYRTKMVDNDYLSSYHQILAVNRMLRKNEDWQANSLKLGSDTCLGGDYTLATVIYPNQEVKSMFVRCWWLGSSRDYIKK